MVCMVSGTRGRGVSVVGSRLTLMRVGTCYAALLPF
jgi:hypothetical protein